MARGSRARPSCPRSARRPSGGSSPARRRASRANRSARRRTATRGPATSARAMATRCAWPPDSSPGRRCSRPSRPSRANQSAGRLERRLPMAPVQQERKGDVLDRGQLRDELAELEDEAEVGSAQAAPFGLAKVADATAVEADVARVGDEDAGQAVEERRLARATGTHDREDLTGVRRRRRRRAGLRSDRSASCRPRAASLGIAAAPRPELSACREDHGHARASFRIWARRSSIRADVISSQRRSASRW